MTTRLEHDFLGEREIEDTKYYGVQTLRAQASRSATKVFSNHLWLF